MASDVPEMVERVARAMVESSPIPEGCVRGDVNWEAFHRYARVAIQAMREPTPEMVSVAFNTWPGSTMAWSAAYIVQWQAVIDAALAEERGT